jgi:1-acyl-sn-glycerol-3-phosphate acyltransferase
MRLIRRLFMRIDPLTFIRKAVEAFVVPADPDDLDSRDPEMLALLGPVVDVATRIYYRLEVEGLERVPDGKALVVINHNAGITFAELLGFGARFLAERGLDDPIYGLGHDGILAVPLLKNFLIKAGGVRASHRHADRVMEANRKILVAPWGNLEAYRPFKDRNRIDFGGRTGFLKLAVRHGAPIVPAVFIGGQETFAVLHDGRFLARALGLKKLLRIDTFPIFLGLPWGLGIGPLFHLPLPAKCKVRVLDPIPTDGYSPEDEHDEAKLRELYGKVTGAMQQALTEMAAERRWPVLG